MVVRTPLRRTLGARPWSVVLVVAGGILVASVVPLPGSGGAAARGPLGLVALDKWAHAVGYAALAAALRGALAVSDLAPVRRRRRAVALAVVLAVAYGGGIELLQSFARTRSPSAADAAANLVGAGVGAAVAAVVARTGTAWPSTGPSSRDR